MHIPCNGAVVLPAGSQAGGNKFLYPPALHQVLCGFQLLRLWQTLVEFAPVQFQGIAQNLGNPGEPLILGAAFLLGRAEALVYAILLRYWGWTAEDDVRPRIYLMSD